MAAVVLGVGLTLLVLLSTRARSGKTRSVAEFFSDRRHPITVDYMKSWPAPMVESGSSLIHEFIQNTNQARRLRYLRIGPWLINVWPIVHHRQEASLSVQIDKWTSKWPRRDHFSLSEIKDQPPWTALYVFAPHTPPSLLFQRQSFQLRFDTMSSQPTRIGMLRVCAWGALIGLLVKAIVRFCR